MISAQLRALSKQPSHQFGGIGVDFAEQEVVNFCKDRGQQRLMHLMKECPRQLLRRATVKDTYESLQLTPLSTL
jgi:hypothetical protein